VTTSLTISPCAVSLGLENCSIAFHAEAFVGNSVFVPIRFDLRTPLS
jgi:hypothetical protein